MADTDLLAAMGVRVWEVDGLEEGAVFVDTHEMLLLDRALGPAQRARLLDQCLMAAAVTRRRSA